MKMNGEKSRHRGAHPADRKLFAPAQISDLRRAVSDLSWLFSQGYTAKASLKLVGDRYALKERQRLAVSRAACSDQQEEGRKQKCLPLDAIEGRSLLIDGFNIIITVEAALSGGVLLHCRDRCIRDLSSVHGSYRSVMETEEAIHLIGETLMTAGPASATWLLDQPISNSGRLAQWIREVAAAKRWPWEAIVIMNPDRVIRASDQIAVTSDSNILDGAAQWVNLNGLLISKHLPQAWIIDLARAGSPSG
jgi:hypothetical protein